MNFNVLKIKEFNDSYQYSYFKLPKSSSFSSYNISSPEEVFRCSCSRTISLIKDYIKSNDFKFFVTLTLKDHVRYSINSAYYLFKSTLYNYSLYYKRHTGKILNYLFVFELTEDGGLHCHGFMSDVCDGYLNNNGYLSSFYLDRLGFQSFSNIEDVNVFYLIKYIYKKPIKDLKRRFFRSRNLKKPKIYKFYDNDKRYLTLNWSFSNNYCNMLTLSKY